LSTLVVAGRVARRAHENPRQTRLAGSSSAAAGPTRASPAARSSSTLTGALPRTGAAPFPQGPTSGPVGRLRGALHRQDVVAAGLADRLLVQLAYASGSPTRWPCWYDSFGPAGCRPPDRRERAPALRADARGMIEMPPISGGPSTSRPPPTGTSGGQSPSSTWERTDRAAAIRADAGSDDTRRVVASARSRRAGDRRGGGSGGLPQRQSSTSADGRAEATPTSCEARITSTRAGRTAAGSIDEVARAATALGLGLRALLRPRRWRTLQPPTYRSGVLVSRRVEIRSHGGHYVPSG